MPPTPFGFFINTKKGSYFEGQTMLLLCEGNIIFDFVGQVQLKKKYIFMFIDEIIKQLIDQSTETKNYH